MLVFWHIHLFPFVNFDDDILYVKYSFFFSSNAILKIINMEKNIRGLFYKCILERLFYCIPLAQTENRKISYILLLWPEFIFQHYNQCLLYCFCCKVNWIGYFIAFHWLKQQIEKCHIFCFYDLIFFSFYIIINVCYIPSVVK